jgi:hypothetical protein
MGNDQGRSANGQFTDEVLERYARTLAAGHRVGHYAGDRRLLWKCQDSDLGLAYGEFIGYANGNPIKDAR